MEARVAPELQHLTLGFTTNAEVVDAARFFADVLALTVRAEPADGYAEVDARRRHPLAAPRPARRHARDLARRLLVQLGCDDSRVEVETLRARGADVALEPVDTDWGTTSAYVGGPHGVLVEVFSWQPGQAPA